MLFWLRRSFVAIPTSAVQDETSHNRISSGATVASEDRREFNVRVRPFRPRRLDPWVTQALRPALCPAELSARKMPLENKPTLGLMSAYQESKVLLYSFRVIA
jgi:hypothetical protein